MNYFNLTDDQIDILDKAPDMITFIKLFKVFTNLTDEKLGNILGVTKQTVSNWIRGRVSISKMVAICFSNFVYDDPYILVRRFYANN